MSELLSSEKLRATGLFKPAAVSQLSKKIEQGGALGETDDMALVGIISTQLLHHHFIAGFDIPRPLSEADPVRVCSGSKALTQKNHYAIHQGRTRN